MVTEPKSSYWCKFCKVWLRGPECARHKGKAIKPFKAARIRPVWARELDFIRELSGQTVVENPVDFMFWRTKWRYYIGPKSYARVTEDGGKVSVDIHNPQVLEQWKSRSPEEYRTALKQANQPYIDALEAEAIDFMVQTRNSHSSYPLVVSFSGGKDSIICSELAAKAFPDENVIHVFGDTQLEHASTYHYLDWFDGAHPNRPLTRAKPLRDFWGLLDDIGPPSRFLRWCCTTQKAYPLSTAFANIADGRKVLSICGVRAGESPRRKKYERINNDTKIDNQLAAYPILHWSELDVWVYLLASGLSIPESYEYGLTRLGCVGCPLVGDVGVNHVLGLSLGEELIGRWREATTGFFSRAAFDNPEKYYDEGGWRGRLRGQVDVGGVAGSEKVYAKSVDCKDSDVHVSYHTKVTPNPPIIAAAFSIFGNVTEVVNIGNMGIYTVDGPHGITSVECQGNLNRVKVQFASKQTRRKMRVKVRGQIQRAMGCVGCGGCSMACPVSAISYPNGRYSIDPELCAHCLVRTTKAVEQGSGCIAVESLRYDAGEPQ